MTIPFNADEVFEIAEQIERNGAKFYRTAAERFPVVNKLFLELAAMEVEHEKTFAAMHAEISDAEREVTVFDPEGEGRMYLRALAEGNVFDTKTDPVALLDGMETAEEVLRMAIGLEKESVVFYVGLKSNVSARAGKDKVEVIIGEEINHIAILSKELAGLK